MRTKGGKLQGDTPEPMSELASSNWAGESMARVDKKRHLLLLLVPLSVFALTIRLVSLSTIPPNVSPDEADNLRVVYHILVGKGPGFFDLDWKPAPAFSVYLISLLMRIFGLTIVGMRMASVVLSVGAVIAFYLFAHRGLSEFASLWGALLLSSGLWYLHFSRNGWDNVQVSLFTLGAALFLDLAIRQKDWRFYVSTGVFASLGLYGHLAGRLIILAILGYFPLALFLNPHDRKHILKGYAIILLTAMILFLPQARIIWERWEHFNSRVQLLWIWNVERPYLGDSSTTQILLHQVERTLRSFFLMDPRVNAYGLNQKYLRLGWAFLDPLSSILYWVGLVVSVIMWKRTALWWCFLVVLLFPIQILSSGTPDGARAIGAAPFLYLFIALGIDRILYWGRRQRRVVAGFVAVVLSVAVAINLWAYVDWMESPTAAYERQPAVEAEEFETWQRLQIEAAQRGTGGFNVREWHEMRGEYGFVYENPP